MADQESTKKEQLNKILEAYRSLKALESAGDIPAEVLAPIVHGVSETPVPELVKKAGKKAMDVIDYIDENVSNRSRAAILSALKKEDPIAAAVENKPVEFQEVGTALLKKLEENKIPVAKVKEVDISSGDEKEIYPAAGPIGFATSIMGDPTNYANLPSAFKFARSLKNIKKIP